VFFICAVQDELGYMACNALYSGMTAFNLQGGVDKSVAWPTSWCCRMELLVSLERGARSCAELQVFSCYRGWKEACKVTRMISTSRRELSSDFFPARQGTKGNSRHSDRNIRGTCTIICHCQKLGGPVETWWFLHLRCASSWMTKNSDHPGNYWSNSRVNLGRPPDFGYINSWWASHVSGLGPSFKKIWTWRKFFAKWVLKCLKVYQKHQRCQSSE